MPNCHIYISSQQIMDIAVIPVLKKLISDIVSSLLDANIFGHYRIIDMVITGSFLRQKEENSINNQLITTEIEKEFKEQMRGRVYEFKINMDTPSISNGTSFYEIFLRGELRIVAHRMYWYEYEFIIPIMIQESELSDKRVPIKFESRHSKHIFRGGFTKMLTL